MKYNKLLSRCHRAANGPDVDEARCSGRTTAIKLSILAWCIKCPGEWHMVEDHHKEETGQRNCRIASEIIALAKMLGLHYFEVDYSGPTPTIRCNLFTDNPWTIL